MASRTIKISGVSTELLKLLDERISAQRAGGRSQYLRELIRRDVVSGALANGAGSSFREILAPVHEETHRLGYTNDEIERDVEEALGDYRRERARQQKAPAH